jgi:hypothetical protein
MTDNRLEEVKKLVHEHLNAAMLMVRLDDPLDPDLSIGEALAYFDQNEFDLALLHAREVRVVYRERLEQVPVEKRIAAVKTKASSPRGDRLIEHSLELGEVARRLREDNVPLLVVGRDGPAFIVTRSDFTRPAGLAGVLAVIAALDAQLDELLRPFDSEAWTLLDEEARIKLEAYLDWARKRSEEVHRLSYLTLRQRFRLVRDLELGRRLAIDLGNEPEHDRITSVRNDIAHGRPVRSGADVIAALEIAERILDSIERSLDRV